VAFEAVIFDLDGTLFDHEGAARAGVAGWLKHIGVRSSEPAVAAWFDAEQRHIAAWHRGEVDWQGQRRARIRQMLDWLSRDSLDVAAIDASFAIYLELYQEAWRAFDDAGPAVDALRDAGLTVAVLTNGADDQQRAKLATIGLAERSGPLFSSDAIGFAKPDPRAYHHVCERLMVVPSRVVHVGDRYDVDVLAARTAGLHAVHLDRTSAGPHDETARIQTLRDLPDLLRNRVSCG